MPTYSYACTECSHSFDAQQAFTDDALTECPACGSRLRKLFGNVGVVFKGSGFYRNDARRAEKDGKGVKTTAGEGGSRESTSSGATKADGGSASGSGGSSGSSGSDSSGAPASVGAGSGGSSTSGAGASTSTSPAPAKTGSGTSAR